MCGWVEHLASSRLLDPLGKHPLSAAPPSATSSLLLPWISPEFNTRPCFKIILQHQHFTVYRSLWGRPVKRKGTVTGVALKTASEHLSGLPWHLIQARTLTASELVFICLLCRVAEVISEAKNHFPNLRRSLLHGEKVDWLSVV